MRSRETPLESLGNRQKRSRWFGGGKVDPGIHSIWVEPRDGRVAWRELANAKPAPFGFAVAAARPTLEFAGQCRKIAALAVDGGRALAPRALEASANTPLAALPRASEERMSGVNRWGFWTLLASGETAPVDTSIFSPAAPAAESIVSLAVLVFAVAALIFIVVEGVLCYTLLKFRRGRAAANGEPPQVYGSNPIEIAWTVAPGVIVFFLVLVTTRTLWEVNAGPLAPHDGAVLEVTVIGRQWWWEYQYRSYDGRSLEFATAGELHIPAADVDSPRWARLTLQSADVCHSFWVPRLEGKVDAIPGRTNTLWLEAAEPGLYFGQCAEYCGTQHAHMMIRVVVDTPEDFERWLQDQSRPAVEEPSVAQGQAAFLSASCVNCHRIRGTLAAGNYAPDLTHLMSRQTFAGGMIENNPENLARWVRDPQSIKPGCLMPAFGLDRPQQDLIVQYLSTLR